MAREKRLSAALVMVGSVQIQLADGSNSAPAIAFRNDPDTGLYSSAANELSIATGGTQRAVINSSGQLSIVSTTDSSSPTTGATVIAGGLGVAKAIVAGNNISAGVANVSSGTLSASTSAGSNSFSVSMAAATEARLVAGGASNMTFYTNGNERVSITSAGQVNMSGGIAAITRAAATTRDLKLQTAGSDRWIFRANATAEGGSNAGTDLEILARDDAGSAIDTPISITRAAGGNFTTPRPFRVTSSAAEALIVTGGTRLGATNNLVFTSERLSVLNQSPSGAATATGLTVALNQDTTTAITSTTRQYGALARFRRDNSLDVTDTVDRMASLAVDVVFTPSATRTYTNTGTNGISGIFVAPPVLNGAGALAITNFQGITVANQGATGLTNVAGIKVIDQSGGTTNYAIQTGTGLVDLGDKVRVNTTGTAFSSTEQVSMRSASPAVGSSANTLGVAFQQSSTSPVTATQIGIGSFFHRNPAASVTDTAQMYAIGGQLAFTVASGQTTTNTNSSGVSGIKVLNLSLSGPGSLAITRYNALYVEGDSVTTGGEKNGLRIGDITNGTTNFAIQTASGIVQIGDDLKLNTVGKGLYVKEGSNATMGTATLSAGSATVSTTKVTANSRIFLTSQSDGGTVGFLRVSARTASTSFTITSSSALDTSTVAWMIVEPA